MMTLPNFLIIGTPKCGTTSLHEYLKEHPQVFMSTPKELTFFGHEGTDGLFNGPHDDPPFFGSSMKTSFIVAILFLLSQLASTIRRQLPYQLAALIQAPHCITIIFHSKQNRRHITISKHKSVLIVAFDFDFKS